MTLMKWFQSRCVRCYLAGLVTLGATLFVCDALNPRSLPNGSWFEPLVLPLTGVGLLLCIIAPFLSRRPAEERVGFALVGLGGAFLTVVASWMLTAMLFGAFPI